MSENTPQAKITADDGAGRQKAIDMDLPANSNKAKTQYSAMSTGNQPSKPGEPVKARVKATKIVTTEVRVEKPGLFSRIKTSMMGEDSRSVGNYLLHDVVVPAFKNLINEAISQGTERLLFGSTSSRPRGLNERHYTSYGSMSTSRQPFGDGANRREPSRHERANHDFDRIIIGDRREAEDILVRLYEMVQEYGSARVSDLYEMVGITGEFTDDKFGWTTTGFGDVKRVSNGYLLVLPRPVFIE